MSDKRIIVRLRSKKQVNFKVAVTDNGYTIFGIEHRFLGLAFTKIGKAHKMEDALEIVKSNVGGEQVESIDIERW